MNPNFLTSLMTTTSDSYEIYWIIAFNFTIIYRFDNISQMIWNIIRKTCQKN